MSMRPALFAGETISACLAHAARAAPHAVTVFPTSGERITLTELDEAATRAAHGFAAAGVGPGDVVGVLVPPTPWFLTTLFGLMRVGAAVSVLPVQAGFSDDVGAARRLTRIAAAAGMRNVVLDDSYATIGRHLVGMTVLDPRTSASGRRSALPTVGSGDLAVVQFTSGSTSAPKGVMLPHSNLVAGVNACVVSAGFSPDDVFVQWVPTYHDMGLIGLCSHLLNGADVHLFSPSTFLRRPAEVLAHFAANRATVLAGPNFSYDYLLDALTPELLAELDLSSWRLAFNGAEPVRSATVRRFMETLAPTGVQDSVMYPVYGMAEATLSISYPELGVPPRVVVVDRDQLATSGTVRVVAPGHHTAKELVSVGRAVHGLRLRIVAEDGSICPEGTVGEIRLHGPSLCTGYLHDQEATGRVFDGSWLRTGDLGFRLDGDLFVAGRRKEMVIVRGQNFFPDDVEEIAREVPGVYRGRCVAYSDVDADGDEYVGVIVESDGRLVDEDDLRSLVTTTVSDDLGLAQVRVHVVKPRWLTRTTSGKMQRTLARQRMNGGWA